MKKLLVLVLIFSLARAFPHNILPTPDHIVVLVFENHDYSQIMGSPSAPHINDLALDPNSALFLFSYGIEHPSQPNYLDLYSGCNQGVTDNNVPAGQPFTTPNLGYQLISAGKTFTTYSDGLPEVGFNGATSGSYARRHNPAANWMGTGENQIPPETNQPFTAFPSSDFNLLPDVCFVVPDVNNDMHDGTISAGDDWFYSNLNDYVQWAKTHNSLFILTFDEDNYQGDNHIVTIFTGQMIAGGEYSEIIDHYSILRTIEDLFGLPYACNASTANTITDCWITTNVSQPTEIDFSINPIPASQYVNVEISDKYLGNHLKMNFFNILGVKTKEVLISNLKSIIPVDELKPGIYLLQLEDKRGVIKTEKIIIE